MKGIALLIALVLLAPLAAAQDPFPAAELLLAQHRADLDAPIYTLADLEAAALAHNPELRAATLRVAVLDARVPQAGALDDPMLDARSWGVPLRRPWDLNQSQNMVMLSQALPGPGKRALAAKIAQQDVAIARASVDARQRDLLLQVRKLYFDLLRNRDEIFLHDRQVALARQAIEAARVKYTVGKVPQQDVLKAQLALTRLAEHLVMLDEQAALARAALNTLLGRGPAEPLRVVGAYSTPEKLPSLPELEQTALASRPELAALRQAVAQGEDQVALARKAYTPDFKLGAGYMLGPTGMEYRNGYQVEFTMTLPWLNRRKHDAAIQESAAEVAARNAELDARRSLVRQELQEALVRVQSARRLVELYRTSLRPQAETVLRSTSAAYQADRTGFLDVIDSQNVALEVRTAYFRSLADLDTRLSELERAIGAPIARQTAPLEEARK